MKRLCETMGVARSGQYQRREHGTRSRPGHYKRADDAHYLHLIRQIIDKRSTLGYRRVTVFLNRLLERRGEPRVNHKRVYRLMRIGGLLLQKSTGRPQRVHDGTIMMPSSNRRWCSDAFEVQCWSRERLRIAFSLDCCDREVMSYLATTGGINGDMIRDLMLEAVEARFGNVTRLPQPIEWLSDNGSAYCAIETIAFAKSLGFEVCTTPFYSPQSNGMAESFVKTFKRDYIHCNPLYDARYVLKRLPEWFEDYNECHPHKALKMMSPREYRRHTAKLELCPVN